MAKTKVVSYSEVDTYRQCGLKHQLAYDERWRTEDEAEALVRGTLFHSVMERHYKKILDISQETVGGIRSREPIEAQDLFLAVAPLLYEEGTGAQTEMQELVEWIYRGYVDLYTTDTDWEIVAVEHPLEVWLPTASGTRSSFKLAGTVDLIVRDFSAGGGLWIVDHKTCRNLPKGKDLDLEDQTGIYTYLLRKQGLDIRGAIYNHCRTYKLQRDMEMNERFRRTITVRTDQEIETMALEVLDTMREAYRPRPGDKPRSPDGERCGWKCGYTEPCLAGRKYGSQRMREMLRETGFTQHDTKPGPTFNKSNTREGRSDG